MTNPSNVANITDKQPAPAARFIVGAQIDGFPVQVEVEGKASDLRALVDRLKAIGAEPPQTIQQVRQTSDIPRCPIHNAPMKPSRKPGKFYCAKKAEDGEYCREVA